MPLVNQAEFARLHKVSRKTVTTWKARGYLTFSGQLVDVDKSNATLARAGRAWPGIVTTAGSVPPFVTPRCVGLASEPASLSAMCSGGACDMAELMLRHLPMEVVRPLVEEFVMRARRGATEMLDDEMRPPAGYARWADHPAFSGPAMYEEEWQDAAQVAAASGQAGGAALNA